MANMQAWYTKNLNWKGKHREGVAASVVGSVNILAPNSARVGATIVNNGVNWIYVSKTVNAAVVNAGIPLAPNGGSYEINLSNPCFGGISVACAAALANQISWTEDE